MENLYTWYSETHFFSYKFSVLKACIDNFDMFSECTILMQFSQTFSEGVETPPRTPPAGESYPLPNPCPFRASRHRKPFSFIFVFWNMQMM